MSKNNKKSQKDLLNMFKTEKTLNIVLSEGEEITVKYKKSVSWQKADVYADSASENQMAFIINILKRFVTGYENVKFKYILDEEEINQIALQGREEELEEYVDYDDENFGRLVSNHLASMTEVVNKILGIFQKEEEQKEEEKKS